MADDTKNIPVVAAKLDEILSETERKRQTRNDFFSAYVHGLGSSAIYSGGVGIADWLFASGLNLYHMHPFGDIAIGSGMLIGRSVKSDYDEVPAARYGESLASITGLTVYY